MHQCVCVMEDFRSQNVYLKSERVAINFHRVLLRRFRHQGILGPSGIFFNGNSEALAEYGSIFNDAYSACLFSANTCIRPMNHRLHRHHSNDDL